MFDGWDDMMVQNSPEEWRDNWVDGCNFAKEHGIDTILTIQPFLGSGERVFTDVELDIYIDLINQPHEPTDHYYKFAEQLSKLDNTCTKTADLREIFDHVFETIYIDFVHVGPLGNEIIAENFYKLSLPIISERKSLVISDTGADPEIEEKINVELYEKTLKDDVGIFETLFSYYTTPKVIALILNDQLFREGESMDYSQVENFKDQILDYENFAGQDLENAIFYNSSLRGADFSNANLKGTLFRFAKMHDATLVGADLEDANLLNAQLLGADLTGANLKGADLHQVNLARSKLDNVIFENTDLTGAIFIGTDFTKTKMSNMNFFDAYLYFSNFYGMDLSSFNFRESSWAGTDFSYANFDGADLSLVDLSGKTIIVEAFGLDPKEVGFESVVLAGAMLTGVDLSGRDLSDLYFNTYTGNYPENRMDFITSELAEKIQQEAIVLSYANLSRVNLSNQDLSSVNFENADLSNADLSGTVLFITQLSGANLRGSNLSNADLTGANLDGANLTGANLTGAILDCVNHSVCN